MVAYTPSGDNTGVQSFRGDGAESAAKLHFEILKQRHDTYQVWIERLNLQRWEQVAGVQRTLTGDWENIGKSMSRRLL